MTKAMTEKMVFEKVREVLVDALNLDHLKKDEKKEESLYSKRLKADLGAESIDFLDIVFRLERQFGIKIPREELFPESIFQGDPKYVRETDKGFMVLPEGIEFLKESMLWIKIPKWFEQDPRLERLEDLFTVQSVVKYIKWKLKGNKLPYLPR